MVAAALVRGIHYASIYDLLVAGLLLGLLNSFAKPVLLLLSLPFLILTLGLFTLVINALLLYTVGNLMSTSSFHVDGFGPAFWGGWVISITSILLNALIGRTGDPPKTPPRRPSQPPGSGLESGPVIDV